MVKSSGIVIWYSSRKGYGYISDKKDDREVFIIHTEIKLKNKDDLKIGDAVNYKIIEEEYGPKAIDITR